MEKNGGGVVETRKELSQTCGKHVDEYVDSSLSSVLDTLCAIQVSLDVLVLEQQNANHWLATIANKVPYRYKGIR